MEESRMMPDILRRKPTVVLDKRHSFVQSLNIGDKGQLDAVLEIESFRLEMEDDNEMKQVEVVISSAEIIDLKGRL